MRRPLAQFSVLASLMAIAIAVGSSPIQVPGTTATPELQAHRFSLPGLAAVTPLNAGDALVSRAVPLTLVAPAVNEDAVVRANDATASALNALEATQGGSGDGSDIVRAANEQQEKIPIFLEYQVQAADTVSGIAGRFGITPDYVIWNNADVTNADALAVGQTMQIPSVEGIIHSVRVGDNVSDIALRYDADARDIIEFRANGLAGDPNQLQEGSQILVPGGRKVDLAPVAVPEAPIEPGPGEPEAVTPGPAGAWAWPTEGTITSRFGPRHPLGIDIGIDVGSAILAASAGTVSFVGGNPCCSYGYHVIIDHGSGYETLYAHLSDFAVSKGDQVAAGQRIGVSGMTGLSTGPHLHFELHRNGTIQDPMQYLP